MLCRGGGKYTISAGEVQKEGDSRFQEKGKGGIRIW